MGSRLWNSIRWILEGKEKDPPEDVLVEPDKTEGEEKDEASMGGVAGATVPLGAPGAHYPNEEPPGRLPAWKANAKAFGDAQLYKGKKKR